MTASSYVSPAGEISGWIKEDYIKMMKGSIDVERCMVACREIAKGEIIMQ
ncbi:MAG TPA: hypothetical protein PK627_14410 [Bacteroidales bacterium]|nr:hypothetical protein [Bacteroidales bacterium]